MTKEIWICWNTRDGIGQVKGSKLNLFMHKYELFNMENDETIRNGLSIYLIV